MRLPVYLVEDLGVPRNQQAIFVQLDEKKLNGVLFHVTGNIQEGMKYETRPTECPEESITFQGKSFLGWVLTTDLPRINDVCQSNPAPEKQFEGAKRINPTKPLRRCQEWAAETLSALESQGILKHEDVSYGQPSKILGDFLGSDNRQGDIK